MRPHLARFDVNVRELEPAVQRALLLAAGPEITHGDLALPAAVPRTRVRASNGPGEATLDELERE